MMRKIRLLAGTALLGAVLYPIRHEIKRYVLIKRAGRSPRAVGRSVTPQGNRAALGKPEQERQKDRAG